MESIEEWLTQPEGLATRLRALRAQAGLSGKQVADANGWAQSKVSRIESGQQMAKPEDIVAWARTCGAGEDAAGGLLNALSEARVASATFRSRMQHGQVSVQQDYNTLVANSTLIRHLETIWIPGLLQVPRYAKRVLAEMIPLHGLEIDDVDAAVAKRMERQRHLYDPSKRFEFLIDEPAIWPRLVPPPVMREQLDRLMTAIGLETVRLGIIPAGRQIGHTPQGPVQVYSNGHTVVIVEDVHGEARYAAPEDVDAYNRGIDWVWESAAEGDEARDLIVQAARRINDGAPR